MGIYARVPETVEFERYIIPAGSYRAVCQDVWDLGWQKTSFVNEDTNEPIYQHKVRFSWEIDDVIPDGKYKGKRATITREYSLTLFERSNLNKDLVSWRGKAFTDEEKKNFDTETMVGENCLLNITHKESKKNGKPYAIVSGISPIPKGMTGEKMEPENPRSIPDWIKKIQDQGEDRVPF